MKCSVKLLVIRECKSANRIRREKLYKYLYTYNKCDR